jgi:hypothetical protein
MKRLAIAVSIVCAVLVAGPSVAQQKLGDVAGSIKLKKTDGDSVVIDGSDVGRFTGGSSTSSTGGGLYAVLTDCLAVARELSTMVAAAPRIKPVTYSDGWNSQLASIGERLGSLGLELQRQPNAGPAEAAYLKAVDGFDQVSGGHRDVVNATNSRQLVSSTEKRAISDGADAIEEAMKEIRSVDRAQEASAPPPPIDPVAAARSIRGVCAKFGADGTPAFNNCVDEQDAAKNALVGRTGPAVGLDTASFNKIRNGCLYEWPYNYVNRNACETRRAAAAAGR